MITNIRPILVFLPCLLLLSACASTRLGGYASSGPIGGAVAAPAEPLLPDAIEAVPSGTVLAEPLPPLDGVPGEAGPVIADATPSEVAALPRPAAPGGRSAMVGGWTAREASGGSCRVQLSSSPALDLYRASAGACGSKDLAKVTAWDYRDGEVYLYQPGGAVAARLRVSGGGLEGVIAKSGAPLTLVR